MTPYDVVARQRARAAASGWQQPDASTRDEPAPIEVTDSRFKRLRTYNAIMALAHAASAIAMVAIANDFSIEVGSFATEGPPGTPVADGAVRTIGSYPLAWAVAAFAALSAVFHVVVAGPLRNGYRRELEAGRNRFRWVEYSLSATLMIVLIANITGVVDVAALTAIAGANIAMILFGWVMEIVNPPNAPVWWSPFWFGCIAGATPWIAIVWSLVISVDNGAEPPSFVYGIVVSLFVLFNSFAVNQWLQYRRVGPWRNYLFGETTYIALSLVAKLALAWQIYANVLVD